MTVALSLDHIGAMVRDLDAGAARWRRLGFNLAPRSPQMGFDRATGAVTPWATANHVAMFRRGYIELIGIVEPARPNPWARFYERFEGIHIAAFRCPDADAAFADLRRRSDGFDPPLDRRRNAPYGEGVREMRFRNIFSRDEYFPEGRFIVIEHQTPEVLWQEALMAHPNGAVALDAAIFCAADPAPTRDRLAAILGVAAEDTGPGAVRLAAPGGGRVMVLDEAAFARRFPGAAPPPRPCMAGAAIGVADLARTRALLARNGVTAHEGPDGTIWVAPADANGGAMAFVQA